MYDSVIALADALISQSTPERPAWNKEVLLGHQAPGWNYIDGCMLKALLDLYAATQNSNYLDFVDNYVSHFVSDNGNILGYNAKNFNSDHINEGKVLFTLYHQFKREKYHKAIKLLYSQLENQPRTPQGNFWHKQIYPNQVWLDGLYMTLPFYAEYETLFNRSQNISDIFAQFNNVYKNMRHHSSGLMFHGWDTALACSWANPTTGLSQNFWSRSIGWYCMALLDTAEKIDEQQFHERQTLIAYLKNVVDALLFVADKQSGLLWQVTDRAHAPGNYLETSASCALTYSLMKGARLGFLPKYYFDKGEHLFNSILREKLTQNGDDIALTDICLVAGLGVYLGRSDYKERDGTYAYYISEPRVDNDAKGVAPFLMAFAELLRHQGTTEAKS